MGIRNLDGGIFVMAGGEGGGVFLIIRNFFKANVNMNSVNIEHQLKSKLA